LSNKHLEEYSIAHKIMWDYFLGIMIEDILSHGRSGRSIDEYFTESGPKPYDLQNLQDITRLHYINDRYHHYIQERLMQTQQIHDLMEHIIENITCSDIQERMLPSIMEKIDVGLEVQSMELDLYLTHTVLLYQLHRKRNSTLDLPSLPERYPCIHNAIRSSLIGFVTTHQITKSDITHQELFSSLDVITLYHYLRHYKNSHEKMMIDPRFDEGLYGYFGWRAQRKLLSASK